MNKPLQLYSLPTMSVIPNKHFSKMNVHAPYPHLCDTSVLDFLPISSRVFWEEQSTLRGQRTTSGNSKLMVGLRMWCCSGPKVHKPPKGTPLVPRCFQGHAWHCSGTSKACLESHVVLGTESDTFSCKGMCLNPYTNYLYLSCPFLQSSWGWSSVVWGELKLALKKAKNS